MASYGGKLRGYQRVQRLLAEHEWPENALIPADPYPEYMLTDPREVTVECTAALIEELHDAIRLGMSMGSELVNVQHALVTVIDRLTPEGVKALVHALEEANTS